MLVQCMRCHLIAMSIFPVPICEQFRVCNSRASCDVFAAGESNQDAGDGGRRFHVLLAASVRRSSSPLLRTSCPAIQPGVLASCSSQSLSRICTARITQSAITEHISLHKGGFKRGRRGAMSPELGPQQIPGEAVWRLQNTRKPFSGRAPPRTPLGSLQRSHRPNSWWGGD